MHALEPRLKLSTALVNDVNRLPDELISSIFGMIIDGTNAWPRDRAVFRARALARILSVCRLWNSILLATPYVWSTIAFRPRSFEAVLPLLTSLPLWLERSGTVPLHLYVDFRPHYIDPLSRQIVEQVILPHLPRVHELVICVVEIKPSANRKHLLPVDDYFRPKRLEIIVSDYSENGFTSAGTDFFVEAINPARLVNLDLSRCRFDDQSLIDFFSKCNALRFLKIRPITLGPSERLTLGTLEALEYLEVCTYPWSAQIIAHTPNLIHLKFNDHWSPPERWPAMPKLRIFTIVSLRRLVRILELPSTIVDLRIHGVGRDGSLSTIISQLAFSPKEREPMSLPHLSHLRIRVHDHYNSEKKHFTISLPNSLDGAPVITSAYHPCSRQGGTDFFPWSQGGIISYLRGAREVRRRPRSEPMAFGSGIDADWLSRNLAVSEFGFSLDIIKGPPSRIPAKTSS